MVSYPMPGETEKHQSLDTIWNTNKRIISKLHEIKSGLETITEGDGMSVKAEQEKETEVSVATVVVLQQQADRIDILTSEINHLLVVLRGDNN